MNTLDDFIRTYSAKGWQVISRTDTAVQMRRAKQWSQVGIIVGLVGLLFWGIGIVFLILTVLDYLFQREKIGHVTLADLRSGNMPAVFTEKNKTASTAIGAVVFLFVLAGVCYLAFYYFQ